MRREPFDARWAFSEAPLIRDACTPRAVGHTLLSFAAVCAFVVVAVVGFAMVVS